MASFKQLTDSEAILTDQSLLQVQHNDPPLSSKTPLLALSQREYRFNVLSMDPFKYSFY